MQLLLSMCVRWQPNPGMWFFRNYAPYYLTTFA